MGFKYALSLVKEFTKVELKLKYQGSIIGYFWTLLNPLLLLVTLYFVFSRIGRFDVPYYQFYILLGILLWNFFSDATTESMSSLIGKSAMIKKYKFPGETSVIASNLASFVNLGFNLIVFLIFMFIFKVPMSWKILLLPVYLFQMFILTLGVSLFLSAVYVVYRDLSHIWQYFLLLGFFISPIVYPLELIPFQYLKYYLLNPLSRMIVDMRYITIYEYIPDLKNYLITWVVALLVFAFGYYIFKSNWNKLVDEL